MDVRRDIERGLACYGRGAVLEALDAWRQALHYAPRNEEALRLVELVEQRLAVGAMGATPQEAVEEDLTPVSPLSAWLAPSTHPTELELLIASEDGAPMKVAYERSTRPMHLEVPPLTKAARSSVSDRVAFQLDHCQRLLSQQDYKTAAAAAELALQAAEANDDAHAWALVAPKLSLLERAFALCLGNKTNVPFVVRGVRSLDLNHMDHRIGFLLSCVDGHTDVATLLDICGLPRLEALRALASFHNHGIIRMR